MRLRDYLQLLRKRLFLVVTIIFVVTGSTLGITLAQTPTWTADVRLRVRPPAPGPGAIGQVLSAEQLQTDIGTEAELIKSTSVAEKVKEKLHLPDRPEDLINRLDVTGVPNTAVLVIVAHTRDGISAQNLANAFADAYLEVRRQEAKDALDRVTADESSKLKTAQQRLDAADRTLGALPPGSLSYETAKAGRDQALADLLVIRKELEDLGNQGAISEGFGTVIQSATEARPVRSRSIPRTSVFGVLIGLPVALAVVLLLDSFSQAIRTKDEAEELTGAEVLGLVPLDDAWTRANQPRLASASDPYSLVAEAYRTLALNLRNAVGDGATIVITSPGSGEGKTATAVNLAVAFADGGRRVSLVEADLRHPRAYQFLGADFTPGLADVLTGDADLATALQPIRHRLGFLGPGLQNGRADLLLTRSDLRLLFDDVAQGPRASVPKRPLRASTRPVTEAGEATTVLVDAPPVLTAAEVSALASAADGVVLVLRAESTARQAAARAAEQVRRAGGTLLGVVLVGVKSADELGISAGYRSSLVPVSQAAARRVGTES